MKNTNYDTKPQNQSEYENGSHVANRKKAIATTFKKKNFRDVVDLLNEEDENLAEYYAQYVK
jgi:hypothetical protein